MKQDEKKEFYTKCGEILGIPHTFVPPVPKKTRWNTRRKGNGRYQGFGLIRCFGSCFLVTDKRQGCQKFHTEEEVYKYLRKVQNNSLHDRVNML